MDFSERMTALGEDIEQGREYLALRAICEELLDIHGQLRNLQANQGSDKEGPDGE